MSGLVVLVFAQRPGPRTVPRTQAVTRQLSRSTEGGTFGTAIDQRLRRAFTVAAPVDDASLE
ncbi:hypothetical protein ACFV0T_22275 [Streptomyces sp. NPDC059582]|uniref:hypothetical protein n=1 Tax=Streptomyces sp. NPDC059582 TaxID=3346875 RepID=UPI0036C66962